MGKLGKRSAPEPVLATSLLALALHLASCAGPSAIDSADAGRTKAYEPGVPNFDMEAVVRMEDGEPIVDIYNSIPHVSLVFTRSENAFAAKYEIVTRLIERETKNLVTEDSHVRRPVVSDFDSTLSFRPRVDLLHMTAPPGSYIVEVLLTDSETGAMARRRQSVRVPSGSEDEPFASRILLEGIGADGAYQPLVALHMPSMMDSLRATIQLAGLLPDRDFQILMRLLRLQSDTTIASPPYWLAPTRASIKYQGAFFDRVDTLQVTRRSVESAAEDALIVFSLPVLPSGMYRLEVESPGPGGDKTARQERVLSLKSRTFPELVVLDDLVDALAYIAYEREIEQITSAASSAEKKRRFDSFWGSLVPNRNAAANLIKLYYGRIEEANLLFTGYKEGWRTDRGMIYTILGPPLYVEQRVETEVWRYSYSDRDPVNTFIFERVQSRHDGPFETYILQRQPYYQHGWARAVDRLRSGHAL